MGVSYKITALMVMYTQTSPTFCCGTSVVWAEPRHHNVLECQGVSYDAISSFGEVIPFTRDVEINKLVIISLVNSLVKKHP